VREHGEDTRETWATPRFWVAQLWLRQGSMPSQAEFCRRPLSDRRWMHFWEQFLAVEASQSEVPPPLPRSCGATE